MVSIARREIKLRCAARDRDRHHPDLKKAYRSTALVHRKTSSPKAPSSIPFMGLWPQPSVAAVNLGQDFHWIESEEKLLRHRLSPPTRRILEQPRAFFIERPKPAKQTEAFPCERFYDSNR